MNPGVKNALVIARRSRKNLDFIYAQKQQKADVEEFTQLLNSMLGMLICLREEYFKNQDEVTWDKVEEYGLQPIPIEGDAPNSASPKLKHTRTFSRLISNLRHAFAHSCFDLVGNPITGVRVWNIPLGKKDLSENRVWQAELTEQQLLGIANLFIDFLEQRHGQELAANAT